MLAAATLAITLTASASAAEPTFTQLTDTPFGFGMFEPSITPDGALVAFSSSYDFTGNNADNNFEVFLLDLTTGHYTQLTHTPFGIANFEPMITPDGAHVVFRSAFDYTGQNPDGLFELFEVDTASLAIRQITDNPPGISVFEPDIAHDGSWIAYRMAGNPNGTNDEGNFEVFRVHRTTEQVEQLTFTALGQLNSDPAVNDDGSRIAFRSRVSFDGSNPNNNIEIWVWDEAAGITAVTQSTTPQENTAPDIDAAGRFVSFISRFDFTGDNPAANLEVYVADTLTGQFEQATSNGPLLHIEPAISPDGAFVIFESQRDPLGLNPDLNRELFLYNIAGAGVGGGPASLHQLTDTTGGASIAQLSDRAAVNYCAIAADTNTFVWRYEHSIDPAMPNDGGNFELFHTELSTQAPPCPGDANDDGAIDSTDLNILLATFGEPANPRGAGADFDADGIVTSADLNILLALFAEPCNP